MRIALLSDTHGVLDGRIAELVTRCEMAVHAGDIGAEQVLEQLRPKSGRVVAVRGNNDIPAQWRGDSILLESLPAFARIVLPGGILIVVHGHRTTPAGLRHEKLRERFVEARAIVYGHTHRLVCDISRTPWILNPGAAGRARTHGGPSCLLLVAAEEAWTVEARRFPLTRARKGTHECCNHNMPNIFSFAIRG